jgi:hypothetical protein
MLRMTLTIVILTTERNLCYKMFTGKQWFSKEPGF